MAAIRTYPLLRAAVADASRVVHDLAAACQQPIDASPGMVIPPQGWTFHVDLLRIAEAVKAA